MSSPQHPGKILDEEYLKPLGIDIRDLAQAINVDEHNLNDLITAQRSCTGDMALRLAKALNTKPQFWLGLQVAYDLCCASAEHGREVYNQISALI